MKHLVTGGCGFIGSNLVDRLVDEGHEVIVIDNLSAESNEQFYFNNKATYHHIDIRDFESIVPLFDGVDVVYHLAAESRIQPIINNPRLAVEVNVLGTCNILEASRIHNVSRVIYSSTSSTYGLKNIPPLREDMETDCLNSYSTSKKSGEDLCKLYHKMWGLETVIFRYFNVYGEREPTKGQYAPVVGKFIKQVRNGEPMTVVGNGEQRRDFTHVSDIVEANILASNLENKKIVGEIINVGTGTNHSVIELARIIGNNITFVPERQGEAWETLADVTKIQTHLRWKPKNRLNEWLEKTLSS
jgi:UDP-glucose 4-epimerase